MAVISCDFYSVARKGLVSFSAILPIDPPPVGMEPVKYVSGRFPTIYLLHGYSGNRTCWLYNEQVMSWAAKYGYAVIMPDGMNRFYLDNEDTGELYGEFIGKELVDVTRSMFPLSQLREETVIAGISMGGFGAIRNGLKYAETFGAIIGHSSALITDEVSAMKHGSGNAIAPYSYYRHTFGDTSKIPGSDKDPKYLAISCLNTGRFVPRLFMTCGSEDFLYQHNCDFHEYLVSIDYPHEWWVQPGVHDFDFWNKSMQASMNWLTNSK
jgi:S-formylglutathione hydrolase FrmB